MPFFRKKPVTIEAIQFIMPMSDDMPLWLRDAFHKGIAYYMRTDTAYLIIETSEGEMRASLGDWIIQGVNGEIYPCKPDVFQKTYEPVVS